MSRMNEQKKAEAFLKDLVAMDKGRLDSDSARQD
jgi:hypothetical protein